MTDAGVPRAFGNSPSQDFLTAWRRLEWAMFARNGDEQRLACFRRLLQFLRANKTVVEYYFDTAETMAYLIIETNWLGVRTIIVAEDDFEWAVSDQVSCTCALSVTASFSVVWSDVASPLRASCVDEGCS